MKQFQIMLGDRTVEVEDDEVGSTITGQQIYLLFIIVFPLSDPPRSPSSDTTEVSQTCHHWILQETTGQFSEGGEAGTERTGWLESWD